MKKYFLTLLPIVFGIIFTLLIGFAGNAIAGEQLPGEVVPINGEAYWATNPTGPDFEGVELVPFQAQNPSKKTWEETIDHVEGYLIVEDFIENIQVSESGWFTEYASHFLNDFSEVMVYLDPTDPNHLLGASKFFYQPATYDFYTGVFESYDAGLTWTQFQPAGIEIYDLTSDPVTTFDHLGNGYFILLTRGPTGLDMLKKPVGGSWELPVVVDRTTYTDKQWIMGDQDVQGISPYAGNLYMSWTSFGGPVTGIVFSRSEDGNQTWTSPIQLAGGDVQGSIPGVAPNGTVYVVYGRGIFYGGSGTLEIVKSTSGGSSFGPPTVAANIIAIPFHLPDPFSHPIDFRTPASLPAFAVSPTNGYLYLAWADYRNGDSDIYFSRSIDGGLSWDTPVRLNDDPVGNGLDQFQPQVSVAPNGRVAIMWFDRRLPCPDLPWIPQNHVGVYNGCIDTFMTRSFDDGQTWVSNIRASAQTWDWTLNLPIDGSGNGFIGDYQGIASNNDFDFPFWNATANLGENVENYQEIFVARVSIAPYIYQTNPGNGEISVPLTIPIEVNFSAPVITNTLVYTITPDPGVTDELWNNNSTILTLTHNTFDYSELYTVTVSVTGKNGLGLVPGSAPNPWSFTTIGLPPEIVSTHPYDGQSSIPITDSLVVSFSKPVSPTTFMLDVNPDPGGWDTLWSSDQQVVTLTHDVFDNTQAYTVSVYVEDNDSQPLVPGPVPNPWMFVTQVGPPPEILSTNPYDDETNVPITSTIVIIFSEPVVSDTLVYTSTPDPGGWVELWSTDNSVLTLYHADFEFSQIYTLHVDIEDIDGQSLIPGSVPNPWDFKTVLGPPPFISSTLPADGDINVPVATSIEIYFSEPVVTYTFSNTVIPDTRTWIPVWNETQTMVMLTSDEMLEYEETYTISVDVLDYDGLPLAAGPVPNPWSFTTESEPAYNYFYLPYIQK
jgi:hypothetical protein